MWTLLVAVVWAIPAVAFWVAFCYEMASYGAGDGLHMSKHTWTGLALVAGVPIVNIGVAIFAMNKAWFCRSYVVQPYPWFTNAQR